MLRRSREEIERLIELLHSLHEGDRAMELLVECGEEAIQPLRKALLEDKPSHIYQPRQRTVNVLAKLGAKDVLIEYLCTPQEIADPLFQYGEDAVKNTAARALARWQTDDVFEALLRVAHMQTLPGVIEVLGLFRLQEAIPLFITALMDDVSRNAAENALRLMGEQAKQALMEAAVAPVLSEDYESPSTLLRRRSAIRLLAELTVTTEEWSEIEHLLYDNDPEISILAACIALDVASLENKSVAVRTLLEKIPHVNWCVRVEIEDCLMKHYGIIQKELTDEIVEREKRSVREDSSDPVLWVLRRIKRRIDECEVGAP